MRNKMLIADDSGVNRALLREIFKSSYEIIEASDGDEAISAIKREASSVAVVLLDLIMPKKDGYSVLSEARMFPPAADIPIIVVTSTDDAENEIKIFDLGATDIITKPFDPRIIVQRVKNVVQKNEIVAMKIENALLREQTQAQIQLSAILDNIVGGIALLEMGKKPRALYLNRGYYAFSGYTPEEVARHREDISFRIHRDDREILHSVINAAVEGHRPFLYEYRAYTREGEIQWVHIQGVEIKYDESEYPVLILILTDITKLKVTESELRYRANHDVFTGIYNEIGFHEATQRMLAENPDTDYILIRSNIEKFKLINELYGNIVGDSILKKMADFLSNRVESVGTYGRIQADHFAACVPKGMLDYEEIKKTTYGREDRLGFDYVINIGVYEITDRSVPVDRMCDFANMALQSVKGNFVKRLAFYDAAMGEAAVRERMLTAEMDRGIEEGQFVLHFQPVYSMVSGEPVSAEALVRWNHPTRGLIYPGDFIPVFEKNGQIARLDAHIWETALRYLRRRADTGKTPIPISVNISRMSMNNTELAEDIDGLVKKYKISPSLLKLEITESAYNDNPELIIETVKKLQKYGFTILMDDFGSGYSSLNTLKDIPVDILKVDMKFLSNIGKTGRAGNILTSVIRMAKWLGIPVIAEGVETQGQAEFLRSVGCDKVQGYYYSRPVPAEKFEELIGKVSAGDVAIFSESYESSDFDMLFSGNKLMANLLNGVLGAVGIYSFRGGRLEVLRVNDNYYSIMGGEKSVMSSSAVDVMTLIPEEDRQGLLDACEKAMKTQGRATAEHRRVLADGSVAWMSTHIQYLGGSADYPLLCLILNDITEKKQSAREHMISDYSSALFTIYDEVYELNFKEDAIYLIESRFIDKSKFPNGSKIEGLLYDWVQRFVHEEDRQAFLSYFNTENISKNFVNSPDTPWNIEYRMVTNDKTHWCKAILLRLEDGVYLHCNKDITKRRDAERAIAENDLLKAKQTEQERYRFVVEQAGYIVIEWEPATDAFYYSPAYAKYAISRYSTRELIHGIDYSFVAHRDDIEVLSAFFKKHDGRHGDRAECEARLLTTDGEYRSTRLIGHFIRDEKKHFIRMIGIIEDIEEKKREERITEKQEEIFKLLMYQSQLLIFDYDCITDRMDYSISMPGGTRAYRQVNNYIENFGSNNVIHTDYKSSYLHLMKNAKMREKSGDFSYRANYYGTGYLWYKVTYRSIADENGEVYRIIGSTVSIQDEINRTEDLRTLIAKDSLSGLINRREAEARTARRLKAAGAKEKYALIMIDLDNFKGINDMYGHLNGDRVIVAFADMIREAFKWRGALRCRLGGDEFAVFANCKSEKEVESTVGDFLARVKEIPLHLGIDTSFSASAGIAYAPKHGRDFEALYEAADKALYESKRLGRDRYSVFTKGKKK